MLFGEHDSATTREIIKVAGSVEALRSGYKHRVEYRASIQHT
jgi:hypothetical protein